MIFVFKLNFFIVRVKISHQIILKLSKTPVCRGHFALDSLGDLAK